jgi:GABA(A) receptor-associated protein
MEFIKEFKSEHDWLDRLSRTQTLKQKYPDRIPIIVDRLNTNVPIPLKHKFLVPKDLRVAEFLGVVRRYLPTLHSAEALFLFVGDTQTIPPGTALLSRIYAEYHDVDNFLYMVICKENVFGTNMNFIP